VSDNDEDGPEAAYRRMLGRLGAYRVQTDLRYNPATDVAWPRDWAAWEEAKTSGRVIRDEARRGWWVKVMGRVEFTSDQAVQSAWDDVYGPGVPGTLATTAELLVLIHVLQAQRERARAGKPPPPTGYVCLQCRTYVAPDRVALEVASGLPGHDCPAALLERQGWLWWAWRRFRSWRWWWKEGPRARLLGSGRRRA